MTGTQIGKAIAVTVANSNGAGVPSGQVYAALMGHGVTLEEYDICLNVLIKHEWIVREHSHLLKLGSKLMEASK